MQNVSKTWPDKNENCTGIPSKVFQFFEARFEARFVTEIRISVSGKGEMTTDYYTIKNYFRDNFKPIVMDLDSNKNNACPSTPKGLLRRASSSILKRASMTFNLNQVSMKEHFYNSLYKESKENVFNMSLLEKINPYGSVLELYNIYDRCKMSGSYQYKPPSDLIGLYSSAFGIDLFEILNNEDIFIFGSLIFVSLMKSEEKVLELIDNGIPLKIGSSNKNLVVSLLNTIPGKLGPTAHVSVNDGFFCIYDDDQNIKIHIHLLPDKSFWIGLAPLSCSRILIELNKKTNTFEIRTSTSAMYSLLTEFIFVFDFKSKFLKSEMSFLEDYSLSLIYPISFFS